MQIKKSKPRPNMPTTIQIRIIRYELLLAVSDSVSIELFAFAREGGGIANEYVRVTNDPFPSFLTFSNFIWTLLNCLRSEASS